jgi:hypothetical protein
MFTAHPLLLSFMMKRVSVIYHLRIFKPGASFKDGQDEQSPPTPDPCRGIKPTLIFSEKLL